MTSLEQITKLANFIMAEVDGEPSQNEGAVDCAIRIMRMNARLRNLVLGPGVREKIICCRDCDSYPPPKCEFCIARQNALFDFQQAIEKEMEKG